MCFRFPWFEALFTLADISLSGAFFPPSKLLHGRLMLADPEAKI